MNRKDLILKTIIIVLWTKVCNGLGPTKPEYSTTLETNLRTELFTTKQYEVLQRPDQRVDVNVSLTILTVNDLNIKNQALSISGYLSVKWLDSRLMWSNASATSQDYSNVKFLFSTETYVWRPALIIENSVNNIAVITDTAVPMRIMSDGYVIWNPSGIYDVSCESDTTYYPLDEQECTIKVSSWAYTNTEINLVFDDKPVDLSFYAENGEWELLSATGTQTDTKSRGGSSFSSLTFTMQLRRRPMFHVLNTLFPVALMALLISMVFKLPVDSGDKIGFSLTVLLAYAVYLTMISDNIPSTSVTVCYLSVYLAFILSLAAISVCLTIYVLCLNFRPEDQEVPKWVIALTRSCLLKVAGIKSCGKCHRRSKVEDAQLTDHKTTKTIKVVEKGHPPEVKLKEDDELTWQKLAKIMDRVFFNLYISLIVIVTFVLFLVISIHYYNA